MPRQPDRLQLSNRGTEASKQTITEDLRPSFSPCDTGSFVSGGVGGGGVGGGGPQHATLAGNRTTSDNALRPNDPSSPAFWYPTPVTSTYGGEPQMLMTDDVFDFDIIPNLPIENPPFLQQEDDIDWPPSSATSGSRNTSDSPVVSGYSNINPFDFLPQPPQDTRDAYLGDYLPTTVQQSLTAQHPAAAPGGSYWPRGDLTEGRGFSTSTATAVPSSLERTAGVTGWQHQDKSGQHTGGDSTKLMALRSAPRAAKSSGSQQKQQHHHHRRGHRQAETADERRARSSHNLVEKQYRNRLNAQFEGLLNALPESVRSPATAVGGGGDSDGGGFRQGGQTSDMLAGEKRISKGDILDMSRRYIQTLETEREALEREREELLENMERLRVECAKGAGGAVLPFS